MTDVDGRGTSFEGWAIMELFGHKRLAGFVSSQEVAGGSLVRIDVPATEGGPEDHAPATRAYTKLVGVAAIYGITPCEEALARRAARTIERYNDPLPVALPQLASGAPAAEDGEVLDDDDDEDDFDDEDLDG